MINAVALAARSRFHGEYIVHIVLSARVGIA